jgi:hypothetical protein
LPGIGKHNKKTQKYVTKGDVMGTRADFYIGKGKDAEWIGSIAWDGYPEGIDKSILQAHDESYYRQVVDMFLKQRDDSTFPLDGWPWPWEDSRTTDYSYAFDKNKVYASCFGHEWFDPLDPPEPENEDDEPEISGEKIEFPDMSKEANPTLGKRSGLMIFGVRR